MDIQIGKVYIIQRAFTDMYKIGWTIEAPRKRMATLQTGCPDPLKLKAAYCTTSNVEKILHRLFTQQRVQGEWFKLSQSDLDLIQRLLAD